HIEDVAENTRHKRLPIGYRRLTFNHEPRIISHSKQLPQRSIASIYLRHFKRPLWVIRHLKPMRRIKQKCDRRVRRPALRMLLYKPHELVSNATERIELERMITRSGLEELILALFEIDRRSARHVVEVITLPIPRERRSHRWTITRVIKVIRTGEVLLLRKCRGGVAEIWCVVIEKRAAKLACS